MIDASVSAGENAGSLSVGGDGALGITQGHATTNAHSIVRDDTASQIITPTSTIDGDATSSLLTMTLSN